MPTPNDPQPPMFPEMRETVAPEVDPAQHSLNRALQSGFNMLGVAMIVLALLYLASGVFQVESGKQGLIARFGKLRMNNASSSEHYNTPIFDPGWHIALPDPFAEKISISNEVQTLAIDTFCFSRIKGEEGKPLAEVTVSGRSLTPGVDGAMLTGDKNLSHGIWVFQYKVTNAQALVETVGDTAEEVAPVLQRIAESAILRTVASKTVEDVLLERQSQVAEEVRARVQNELNTLGVGVEIVKVAPELIEPRPVRDAFLKVTRAQNQKQSKVNEANAKAAEILTRVSGDNYGVLLDLISDYGVAQELDAPPEEMDALLTKIDDELEQAGGDVAVLLREARSRANAIREEIGREYEEFTYYFEQYRDNPRVTTIRLWVAMLRDVLSSEDNELFFVPDGNEIEIIINRDPQRVIEAEQARYRKQMEGG